jgi:septal ring factor EnvC (AmiA/AmiB activator)
MSKIQEITHAIRAVQRRLRVLRFYRTALWMVSLATALTALGMLADKIHPLPLDMREKWIGWLLLLGVGVLIAAGHAIFSRLTLFEAALAADLRMGLKERLSSALLLKERAEDPAVVALLEDAARSARNLRPGEEFPFLVSGRTAHLAWPLVALLGIHFLVPSMNLFAKPERKPPVPQITQAARKEAAEKIKKAAEKAKELPDKQDQTLAKLAKDLDALAKDLEFARKDEKTAMAEMSRMSDEVRLKRQDLAKKLESAQQMNLPMQSPQTRDMQKALQNNQFEKAAQLAREMAEQAMQEGEKSSPGEKEQLARELERMAEQLQKDQPETAKAMEAAAQALQQAAKAQSQGNDAQMQQALQNAQTGLSEMAEALASQSEAAELMSQLDQLQQTLENQRREMARATGQRATCSQCRGEGCSQCNGTGQSEGSQGGSGSSPSDRRGMGESRRSSMSTGEWQPGQSERSGTGMGGPGRGRGGQAQYDDSVPPQFTDTRPPGAQNPGEIIAVMNVDGPALKGESQIQYQQVFTEYQQRADEAIQRDEIPAGYRNLVKDYMDSISPQKRGAASSSAAPPPPANP